MNVNGCQVVLLNLKILTVAGPHSFLAKHPKDLRNVLINGKIRNNSNAKTFNRSNAKM